MSEFGAVAPLRAELGGSHDDLIRRTVCRGVK